jgi:gamma-glutamyltranspeptidase/glutathione hydrolase
MDFHSFPYPSRRMVAFGHNGMVATSQRLAAQAGLEMLRLGGNAVDAAIAAAACLTVVEPPSNGIGSDAFAIVWLKDGGMYGLNASGPAPAALTVEALRAKGHVQMPRYGWGAVTVPGTPSAWDALMERFGKLTLAQVLAPAIGYAAGGYPVSAVVQERWQRSAQAVYAPYQNDPIFKPWYNTYTFGGRSPEVGEFVKLPGHARTLNLLA